MMATAPESWVRTGLLGFLASVMTGTDVALLGPGDQ
jgi:hypothetical protein